jgi:hypothetical protein
MTKTKRENEVLSVTSDDEENFEINIHKNLDMDELSSILAFIIKTAISSLENAAEVNEQAELHILQQVEQKLIEDDSSYIQD